MSAFGRKHPDLLARVACRVEEGSVDLATLDLAEDLKAAGSGWHKVGTRATDRTHHRARSRSGTARRRAERVTGSVTLCRREIDSLRTPIELG